MRGGRRPLLPAAPIGAVASTSAPNAGDRAAVWLRAYLAEHGSVLGSQVTADAAAAGIAYGALTAARRELGVRLVRLPGGPGARHMWG